MRRFILFLSSNAGLGYSPVAPGTIGTLAGIPAFFLLAPLPPLLYALTWLGLLFLSFWAAGAAGKIYGVVDDGRIVIDELVGYSPTVADGREISQCDCTHAEEIDRRRGKDRQPRSARLAR
jgi:phosphatidylglycerophosphatase A